MLKFAFSPWLILYNIFVFLTEYLFDYSAVNSSKPAKEFIMTFDADSPSIPLTLQMVQYFLLYMKHWSFSDLHAVHIYLVCNKTLQASLGRIALCSNTQPRLFFSTLPFSCQPLPSGHSTMKAQEERWVKALASTEIIRDFEWICTEELRVDFASLSDFQHIYMMWFFSCRCSEDYCWTEHWRSDLCSVCRLTTGHSTDHCSPGYIH